MKTSCVKCDGRGVIPKNDGVGTCTLCKGKGQVEMTEKEKQAYLAWLEKGNTPEAAEHVANLVSTLP